MGGVEMDAPKIGQHKGECETDALSRDVCEGMYADRTDEVLGLVEALDAILALCAGHDEQSKAISKICNDAIMEYALWTQ
jgi:hypothetical protein